MTRKDTAHHEAAHAVASYHAADRRVPERGIDLDAATRDGARGNIATFIFPYDPDGDEEGEMKYFWANLMIICAGPASDARLIKVSLEEAIRQQPSDYENAVKAINATPFARDIEPAEVIAEAMRRAVAWLNEDGIWAQVQAVASAALAKEGRLSGPEISEILDGMNSSPATA